MRCLIALVVIILGAQSSLSMEPENNLELPPYQSSDFSLIDDPSFIDNLGWSELPEPVEPPESIIYVSSSNAELASAPAPVLDTSCAASATPEQASSPITKPAKRIRKPSLSKKILEINHCARCNKDIVGPLKRHNFTHEREKPFQCSECDYATSQPGNCKRHIIAHHRNLIKAHVIETLQGKKRILTLKRPPRKCNHCNKKFADNYNLERHKAGRCGSDESD